MPPGCRLPRRAMELALGAALGIVIGLLIEKAMRSPPKTEAEFRVVATRADGKSASAELTPKLLRELLRR